MTDDFADAGLVLQLGDFTGSAAPIQFSSVKRDPDIGFSKFVEVAYLVDVPGGRSLIAVTVVKPMFFDPFPVLGFAFLMLVAGVAKPNGAVLDAALFPGASFSEFDVAYFFGGDGFYGHSGDGG